MVMGSGDDRCSSILVVGEDPFPSKQEQNRKTPLEGDRRSKSKTSSIFSIVYLSKTSKTIETDAPI